MLLLLLDRCLLELTTAETGHTYAAAADIVLIPLEWTIGALAIMSKYWSCLQVPGALCYPCMLFSGFAFTIYVLKKRYSTRFWWCAVCQRQHHRWLWLEKLSLFGSVRGMSNPGLPVFDHLFVWSVTSNSLQRWANSWTNPNAGTQCTAQRLIFADCLNQQFAKMS